MYYYPTNRLNFNRQKAQVNAREMAQRQAERRWRFEQGFCFDDDLIRCRYFGDLFLSILECEGQYKFAITGEGAIS